MSWKIIEIENADKINLFLDNIVIKNDKTKIIIPINDIDVLLLNNYKLNITTQLINALTRNNTLVIVCDKNQLPQSYILPIIGNWNTLKVIDKQLHWNYEYKSITWQTIIKQKIFNQISLLKNIQNSSNYDQLLEMLKDIKPYDISNREGHASKIYWHALFGLKFTRHQDDYYNVLLNYGYTILRGYVTRSIIKKGLDPRISIFHKSFHNYFALASDLMEPFRIVIDYEVFKIYKTKIIDLYSHKEQLIKSFNNKILVDNKKQFVNNGIDIFVDAIVNQSKLPTITLDYESI